MVKKIFVLAFALVIMVGFAYAATQSSSSSKQTTSSATKSTTSSKSSATKVEGTFQSMDAKAHTLTVQVGTDTKTYHYSSKTSFMSDKKMVKSSTLKAGDKVDLWVDSKNHARKVEIETGTAEK